MKHYDPSGDGTHTVKVKFMCEDGYCEIVAEIGGNTSGTQILESFTADDFIYAPQDHEGNRKYARFFPEDRGKKCSGIETFIFHQPDGSTFMFEAEDENINRYMIGVEIIDYKPE